MGAITLSLGHSYLALSTLFGIILRGISFFFFYTDYFNRFSIKTYNWRIYQTKVVMEILSFTGKEMVTQEKSV